jgi:hypothetical protein
MNKIFAVVFAALLLAACSNMPIYEVDKHPMPPGTQSMSLGQIEKAIVTAAQRRGWTTEPIAPGVIRATLKKTDHSATVDVAFDQTSYSIKYVTSVNMREKEDGTIHGRVVNWVRLLEKDITKNVRLASTRPTPVS